MLAAAGTRAAVTAPLTGLQPRQPRSIRVPATGQRAGPVQALPCGQAANPPARSQASNVVQAGGLTREGRRAPPSSWVEPAPAAAAAGHPRILAVSCRMPG